RRLNIKNNPSAKPAAKTEILKEILTGLNPLQKKAVKFSDGPLLIVAGAGTGKTTVITRRIAYLISSKKAKPSEILALTFTDKAASEMEERVDMLVPYGFNDVWISTFNAFGDRVLRENALEIGLSTDYRLLAAPEAAVLIKENLFSFPLKHYRPLGNPSQYIASLLEVFSRAKDENIGPDEYIKFAETALAAAREPEAVENCEKQLEAALSYKRYEEIKDKGGFLDFGDQVVKTLKLFSEKPSVLEKYTGMFKYVLIDEFQDTNYSQFEMIKLLCSKHGNITVVGDDDQSIYKFRGACLSNILNFKKTYPAAAQVVLRDNYRSTQPILDSSYKLINHNNPDRLEVRNKIVKKLKSQLQGGHEVKHLHYDTLSSEADEIAKMIKEKHGSGKYAYKDFAVLVRLNSSAAPFIKSFNLFGIPWRFSGNSGLYNREEIRLLLSFLRVMANPEDSLSLHYLASSPVYTFNAVDLALLNHAASHYRRSLYFVLENREKFKELENISEHSLANIEKLKADLAEYYAMAQNCRTGELLYTFLKKSKILERLYNATEIKEIEQAQNIAKFFSIISRFGDFAPYDRVQRFVEHLDTLASCGDDPSVAEADFDIDAVNIMTIHKAKGLEFPVVFMVTLVEQKFPLPDKGSKIELPEGLIKDILPEGEFHIQEERRLFYVGMTRAKDELYLTSGRDYGGKKARKISRFVLEAVDRPQADAAVFKAGIKETIERFAPPFVAADANLVLPGDRGILNLSPYAIDDYITCPQKYKYVHILKVPLLRHHAIVFGDAVHKVLREYYMAKKNSRDFTEQDLVRAYEAAWSPAGFLSREHEDERFRAGREVLIKYFRSEEKSGIVPVSVEEDFKFLLNDKVRVKGRWDRLDERGKERVIVDFKTTGRIKDQEDADAEIKKTKQLLIYAMGHEAKYGSLPDYLELHFLEPGLISRIKPDLEAIVKLKAEIIKVAEGISSRNFTAKPAYMACQYCAYSNICPEQD
ncbi:MAG TPA: hypothetical protein DEE98_05160, partial [Elusimicrobia bacterium]|nr:hypothetical protein [Elusimicrobiota bacterium]